MKATAHLSGFRSTGAQDRPGWELGRWCRGKPDEPRSKGVMLASAQFGRVAQALPILQRADASLACEFRQAAALARIPKGRDMFVEGDRVDNITVLISGVVRVYKIGEGCILTANAILSRQSFPAIATVEQEAEKAVTVVWLIFLALALVWLGLTPWRYV